MKILLDHNIAEKMKLLLTGHDVRSAKEMGWDLLQNGDLLKAGEDAGFQVMLTADQGIFYQQNNAKRKIALLVVNSNKLVLLEQNATLIAQTLHYAANIGGYTTLSITPLRVTKIRKP